MDTQEYIETLSADERQVLNLLKKVLWKTGRVDPMQDYSTNSLPFVIWDDADGEVSSIPYGYIGRRPFPDEPVLGILSPQGRLLMTAGQSKSPLQETEEETGAGGLMYVFGDYPNNTTGSNGDVAIAVGDHWLYEKIDGVWVKKMEIERRRTNVEYYDMVPHNHT